VSGELPDRSSRCRRMSVEICVDGQHGRENHRGDLHRRIVPFEGEAGKDVGHGIPCITLGMLPAQEQGVATSMECWFAGF
jgi:hypothetical protein